MGTKYLIKDNDMECNFVVGQKVVCINDTAGAYRHLYPSNIRWVPNLDGLTKGNIYTIREVFLDRYNEVNVKLNEIIRRNNSFSSVFPGESGYNHARFKPLEETGLDILNKIAANPTKFKYLGKINAEEII